MWNEEHCHKNQVLRTICKPYLLLLLLSFASCSLFQKDIAGTQVLSEVCPTLIGKNATFEQNIQKLIQTNLKAYSGQNMTFAALQTDAEYKSLLADAHQTLKETSTDEQKTVCEDVLSYQE